MVGLHTAPALDLDSLSVPLTEASAHFPDNMLSSTIKGDSLGNHPLRIEEPGMGLACRCWLKDGWEGEECLMVNLECSGGATRGASACCTHGSLALMFSCGEFFTVVILTARADTVSHGGFRVGSNLYLQGLPLPLPVENFFTTGTHIQEPLQGLNLFR